MNYETGLSTLVNESGSMSIELVSSNVLKLWNIGLVDKHIKARQWEANDDSAITLKWMKLEHGDR